MQYPAWFLWTAGWLVAIAATPAARPQPPGNAAPNGVGRAGPTDDEWVSAPGSFASSLSQPVPPLDGAFVFYGSGYPLAGTGLGSFYGFGYFAFPPRGRHAMPLVMALPDERLPDRLAPPIGGQLGGAAPKPPGLPRRPARPAEPRGFGVLADDEKKPDPNGDEDVAPRPTVRAANSSAIARARQFLQFGDERFRDQEFSLALQRYKKAARAAPDLADAYFRQAMAHVALGRYAPAVAAIKRGLSFQPRWATSQFRLDQLYGDNVLAKVNHLEHLAEAASRELDNADLMFLVGVELFFGGQPARARVFFQRAADLGVDAGLLKDFLRNR